MMRSYFTSSPHQPSTSRGAVTSSRHMDALFWINVLSRWLHVTSAVIGIGALVFLRLGVHPILQAQEPSVRQAAMRQLRSRFIGIFHGAFGLMLLTGIYNLWVALPQVRTLTYHSLYHSLIGTKILLAVVLFGIVTAALSSSAASGSMEQGRPRGIGLSIILALVILFLGAVLRRLWQT